tara:strand:- start:145 stop:369 length:225 start_codon:yes stop_codon:yes gene_type:complete
MNILKSENLKLKLDRNLEGIEKGVSKQDSKLICIESTNAYKLINTRIIELRIIEPYYDWQEIKSVMEKEMSSNC